MSLKHLYSWGTHIHTILAQRANLQRGTVSTASYYIFTSWDCATYLQNAHGTYTPGHYGGSSRFGRGKRETRQGGVCEPLRISGCTTGTGKGRATHLPRLPYLLQNKQTEGHQRTEMHRQYKPSGYTYTITYLAPGRLIGQICFLATSQILCLPRPLLLWPILSEERWGKASCTEPLLLVIHCMASKRTFSSGSEKRIN